MFYFQLYFYLYYLLFIYLGYTISWSDPLHYVTWISTKANGKTFERKILRRMFDLIRNIHHKKNDIRIKTKLREMLKRRRFS